MRNPEGFRPQAHRLQQALDGSTHGGIVVNDEHRWSICGRHPCSLTLAGRTKQKLAPRGELLPAHKRPPCDSTMERLMDSPIPVPGGFVVKNALKIWSACCAGSPTPVSLTVTTTCSFSACCDLIASSRVPSTSFIASMPLSMRFISTCCNCTRSPKTGGSSAATQHIRPDGARGRASPGLGGSRAIAAGADEPHAQWHGCDEGCGWDAGARYQIAASGKRASCGDRQRYRRGTACAAGGPDLQGVLYHQVSRHGHGTIHQSLDC